MKILFLPFLQIPTGHHTVADAIIRSISRRIPNAECAKIDFFSYADKLLERAFRLTYLTWIDHSPQTFVWLYKNFVYPTKSTKHFNWYEYKFLDKMNDLLEEEQPDLIVCTQAFPSFLIDRLKNSGITTAPVINVYTDFFINKLWGSSNIDYHFVPDRYIKTQLMEQNHIDPSRIFITGIPIDECFTPRPSLASQSVRPYHILISGGSGGLGDLETLISSLPGKKDRSYIFSLLCGKNKKLYKDVLSLKRPNLKPLSYISSRETINALYDEADAIITKPGGVTISEALHKHLPIFVHSSLPGQEEINKEYLKQRELIYELDLSYPIADQLDLFFGDTNKQSVWQERVNSYLKEIEVTAWQKVMEFAVAQTFKKQPKYKEKRSIISQSSS
ncbi:galactosyldiacylglycerol synthase [Dehalobacter sp. DCM]|uniref:MGDG synthase family glycosyltransferase n=1 Tax=Dehalobacter sp. DCM TaxID=2907827 RepID=UPI0030820A28|nr:galactosyldiacylglycerol synthase [Dehalobacter sp. DCM]